MARCVHEMNKPVRFGAHDPRDSTVQVSQATLGDQVHRDIQKRSQEKSRKMSVRDQTYCRKPGCVLRFIALKHAMRPLDKLRLRFATCITGPPGRTWEILREKETLCLLRPPRRSLRRVEPGTNLVAAQPGALVQQPLLTEVRVNYSRHGQRFPNEMGGFECPKRGAYKQALGTELTFRKPLSRAPGLFAPARGQSCVVRR